MILTTCVLLTSACTRVEPATPQDGEDEHERMLEVLDQTSPRNSNGQWKAIDEFKVYKSEPSGKTVVKEPPYTDDTPTGPPNM